MQIRDRSMRRIVEKQHRLRSHKLSKGQLLTEPMKEKRLQKTRKMLRLIANNRHRAVSFIDEKSSLSSAIKIDRTTPQLLPKGSRKSSLLFFARFQSRKSSPAAISPHPSLYDLQSALFGGMKQTSLDAELARFESDQPPNVIHLGEQSVRYKIHLRGFAKTHSGESLGQNYCRTACGHRQ